LQKQASKFENKPKLGNFTEKQARQALT